MKIYVITEFVDLGDSTAEKEFVGVELSLEDVDWRCRKTMEERNNWRYDGKYNYENYTFNESKTGWGGIDLRGNFFTVFDITEIER